MDKPSEVLVCLFGGGMALRLAYTFFSAWCGRVRGPVEHRELSEGQYNEEWMPYQL